MTKSICPHLEELLPHPLTGERDRSQVAISFVPNSDSINTSPNPFTGKVNQRKQSIMDSDTYRALQPSLSYEAIDQFEDRLREHGLQQYEINIVLDKFCYGLTFEEMAFDLTTNISSIYRIYKQAMGKLKSAGYELE